MGKKKTIIVIVYDDTCPYVPPFNQKSNSRICHPKIILFHSLWSFSTLHLDMKVNNNKKRLIKRLERVELLPL